MAPKKVLITQSDYIPWKGYFDAINLVDEFIIYDDAQYTRRDWRNRNKIKTERGVQWLTIPVQTKGMFHQKIRETRISDPEWGRRHWAALERNYRKAPHFSEIAGTLEQLYFTTRSAFLSEINFEFLSALSKLLGIRTHFAFSSDFELVGDKSERLLHLCKQVGATEYYSGPSAKSYLDEGLFLQEGVAVKYLDYSGYPAYPQLHGPFVHEVSIVDLLFNKGMDAPRYMKSFRIAASAAAAIAAG